MEITEVDEAIDQLNQILLEARQLEQEYATKLKQVHPKWKESATNLIHYITLRQYDLRKTQQTLSKLGMSRLAKAEAHILPSIEATLQILFAIRDNTSLNTHKLPQQAIEKGSQFLTENTHALLGKSSSQKAVSIMVTQPSEAAEQASVASALIQAGMDVARINCAHDSSSRWLKMIQNLREEADKVQKEIKVSIDLAGPKIRTGLIQKGPEVIRFKAAKNALGEVVQPASITIIPVSTELAMPNEICVSGYFFSQLTTKSEITFRDARQKKRKLRITSLAKDKAVALCEKTVYISSDTVFQLKQKQKTIKTELGKLPAIEQDIPLVAGDTLFLVKEHMAGAPAAYDEDGNLVQPAYISCTAPAVFKDVAEGEPILFDDGKIEGEIISVAVEELIIKITHTPPGGAKLKADKGINFPKSDMSISGLTPKDIHDLSFIVQHADVVNLSFVNRTSDVTLLLNELANYPRGSNLGIILKIETAAGYDQLTSILLEAMQHYPLGVMIARGDLAIECGWENLGRIQEEILTLCHAAHIPSIWATQVLESLAKKGVPSRAELTDATMGQRAECIMLNKGENIVQAITMLSAILNDMHAYQDKKAALLPPIKKVR